MRNTVPAECRNLMSPRLSRRGRFEGVLTWVIFSVGFLSGMLVMLFIVIVDMVL